MARLGRQAALVHESVFGCGQRVARMHKIVAGDVQSKQCVNLQMTLRRSLD
jgi:hypothetical protein